VTRRKSITVYYSPAGVFFENVPAFHVPRKCRSDRSCKNANKLIRETRRRWNSRVFAVRTVQVRVVKSDVNPSDVFLDLSKIWKSSRLPSEFVQYSRPLAPTTTTYTATAAAAIFDRLRIHPCTKQQRRSLRHVVYSKHKTRIHSRPLARSVLCSLDNNDANRQWQIAPFPMYVNNRSRNKRSTIYKWRDNDETDGKGEPTFK